MSAVAVRYFTDPGCPHSFCAEPVRLRLRWLFGEHLLWEPRMSVLRAEREPSWTDTDQWRSLHERYGMPLNFERPRAWGDATVHACRAVVAVGLRWPERRDAFLRRLRVLAMAGELLDDSDTLELGAEQAGLPVRELAAYCAEPEVEAALRAEADGAPRSPTFELTGGTTLSGLPAIETAEAALARFEHRADPGSVDDVLRWAAMPLATAEVAAVCARPVDDVRADLAHVAKFEPAGADGYWSYPLR